MWTTIIAAFAPAAIEGVKQIISRFTGGVRATTVEEQLKLDQGEIDMIKALAELDKPVGNPSQWVVDLRASARYLGALAVIGVGCLSLFVPGLTPAIVAVAMEAAGICFGFLFGHRLMVNMKSK